jgi:hypothetical protein
VVIQNQRTKHFPRVAKALGIQAPEPAIVGLRYLTDGQEEDLWGPNHAEAAQLRTAVLERLSRTDGTNGAAYDALQFVVRRIDTLLEPALMEVLAKEQWETAVESGVTNFALVYEKEYLQSEKVIEPFSRLNLEILNLLDPDIKGLKETLQALRWITRWPTKLILVIGRHVLVIGRQVFNGVVGPSTEDSQEEKLPPEFKAYKDAHEVVLNQLTSLIDRYTGAPRHHPFWDALSGAWTKELKPLSEHLSELAKDHMAETDQAIKHTAREIYEKLREQPVLLNTLRTAKVTANVAGVLVGFVLPHHGMVYDLLEEALIAPLLLAGVEATTVGAIGSFLRSRKTELVEKLKAAARTTAAQLYRDPLMRIAVAAIEKTGTLGIDKELVKRLAATLVQIQAQLTAQNSEPMAPKQ